MISRCSESMPPKMKNCRLLWLCWVVLTYNDAVVIKLRIQDKKQHLSKADGYRLIYMVMKQVPLVVLLDVYPKRGPSQQLDIEDNETNRLVREFAAELNAGQLAIHDINDDLKVL